MSPLPPPPILDDEGLPSEEERAAAAALARTLDGEPPGSPTDETAAVALLQAATGQAPPLGELAARRLAHGALVEVRRRRRWLIGGGLAAGLAAAAAMLLLLAPPGEPAWPKHLQSRSAGLLVPGPFPSTQSPADRLDLVAADRLVAWREVRLQRLQRGGRR